MNIKEAIEINTLISTNRKGDLGYDGLDAIKLGIEALKWRLLMEKEYASWCGPPLPGETED